MKRWLSAHTMGFFVTVLGLCLATAQPVAAVCGNSVLEAGEQCDDGNLIAGDCCSNLCLFEAGPGTPPCCSNGICGVGHLCGAACGGGNLFCHYSGGPPSVCQCKSDANAPPLDHYRFYAAVGGLPTQAVTMRDQFQTQRTNLSNVEFFLVPANKNGEGIFDPVPHLVRKLGRDLFGPGSRGDRRAGSHGRPRGHASARACCRCGHCLAWRTSDGFMDGLPAGRRGLAIGDRGGPPGRVGCQDPFFPFHCASQRR